jgi:uncharacterized protein YceK
MRQIALFAAIAMSLSGCGFAAQSHARTAYIHATTALNACLIANPQTPASCNALLAVQQNDLMLYSNLSD